MSAAWLPAFTLLHSRPELLKSHVPPGFFAHQVLRPAVGIALYAMAAILGWFVHPLAAVAIFAAVVAYYAWTSRGLATTD